MTMRRSRSSLCPEPPGAVDLLRRCGAGRHHLAAVNNSRAGRACMHRRRFLKTGGGAGLGLALGACSYRAAGLGGPWVRPANLVPVHVSWDRNNIGSKDASQCS